jgi:hypothetical protein
VRARPACFAALLVTTIAAAAVSSAHAQCEQDESGPLSDIATAVDAGLALGATEGMSSDPAIAAVQAKLNALSGFDAKLSTSALLDASFKDGKFSLDDAKAFVALRTSILDAWSEARRNEDFFWGLDGDGPVSPWQVDASYMNDVRTILADLGSRMDPDAKALLENIVALNATSTVPQTALDELAVYMKNRPVNPDAEKAFSAKLDAAYATWPFEMYKGPNGFMRRSFSVEGAPDAELRAFAERADAAGNHDGKVDLDEMSVMTLLVRMEKTFGIPVDLLLTDEGRNYASVKDGKFQIHIDRSTPAHDVEGALAHEYGHVLLARYDQTKNRSRRDREAEADFISGWVHGTLGFSLDYTGFGWMSRRWKYEDEDPDHGDFRDRVNTIGQGYHAATGKDLFETPKPAVSAPGAPVFNP